MPRRDWTRDELILAMNLYCQLPFGQLHRGNDEIIRLAAAIGRTPSSVAMKLCNVASLDPMHQQRGVKGLTGASAADRRIWAEFHSNWDGLVEESERLKLARSLQTDGDSGAADKIVDPFHGETEANRVVVVRLAQRFFRRSVLASFESKCCVTGISQPDLLIASHIVPWRTSHEHRANPRNGLCLSRLHDGAFDRGLITLDEDYRMAVSRQLASHFRNEVIRTCFQSFEGKPITQPKRFRPDPGLIEIHRTTVFVD